MEEHAAIRNSEKLINLKDRRLHKQEVLIITHTPRKLRSKRFLQGEIIVFKTKYQVGKDVQPGRWTDKHGGKETAI